MLKSGPDLPYLLSKYDKAIPRYTSYPTVPFWDFAGFSLEKWKQQMKAAFREEDQKICIYIHLPFCEELCTYCACNKRITKNHSVEEPYLKAVLKEWEMYVALLEEKPIIDEIHLGGGTPTFFSPQHLKELIEGLLKHAEKGKEPEFALEVHPNFTQKEHLTTLRELGFNRISLGVQDFDPKVQFAINRMQSPKQTQDVVDWARELGYESVNFDLIYGLPFQTSESIRATMAEVEKMRPDRIAFYSYAHVPWKSKGQRRYANEDVPVGEEKIQMFLLGSNLLKEMGYLNIGMDHFALPGDKLLTAFQEGRLHRNFMGYTTTNHKVLIGLGASSIGDCWTAFSQNEKHVEDYQQAIDKGHFPFSNGHLLTKQDLTLRNQILNLMCRLETDLNTSGLDDVAIETISRSLQELIADGLVEYEGNQIKVSQTGRLFLRNIAACLDPSFQQLGSSEGLFSRSV